MSEAASTAFSPIFPPGTNSATVAAVLAAWQKQKEQQPASVPLQLSNEAVCRAVAVTGTPADSYPEVVATVTAARDISAGEVFFAAPLLETSFAQLRSGECTAADAQRRFQRMLGVDPQHERARELTLYRAWRFVDVAPDRQAHRDWLHAEHDDAEPSWYAMDEISAAMSAVVEGAATAAPVAFDCMLVQLEQRAVRFALFARDAVKAGDRCLARCFQRCSDLPSIRSILFASSEYRASALDMTAAAARHFLDATAAPSGSATSAASSHAAAVAAAIARLGVPAPARIAKKKVLTVYTDSNLVRQSLRDPRYVQVEDPARADIVYLVHTAFESSAQFPNARFLSGFPEERLFTDKQALARTVRSAHGYPRWLPRSFDSETELHIFCGATLLASKSEKKQQQQQQLWICKSRALARGMGHVIWEADVALPWLLRCREALPRVICEYIERPLLLRGRKFDVRFVVLVAALGYGAGETEVYIHNEIFPRIAAQPYTLDRATLARYDTHFTLAPHDATPEQLAFMKPRGSDFVREFNAEYGGDAADDVWSTKVMPKVCAMFRDLFSAMPLVGGEILLGRPAEAASQSEQEQVLQKQQRDYLVQRQRFRAMYGCDVMIRADADAPGEFTPLLLECTFSPDSERAVRSVPTFFDEVFATLFRGEPTNCVRV